MNEYRIVRGDIFYVTKYGETTGSEQFAGRPAVVVSNNRNNEHSSTVEIVYCTTRPKEDLPTHCIIRSTAMTSTVLCEQITTVDKQRLGDYVGTCTEDEMARIDRAIRISLGLCDDYEQYNPFPDCNEPNSEQGKSEEKREKEAEDKSELIAVRAERYLQKSVRGVCTETLRQVLGITGMSQKYSLSSEFDVEQHKKTYVNYLEVIIGENGKVVYAVPSHQEMMIKIACIKLGVTREELNEMCPKEWYLDFTRWLCKITGCCAVWNEFTMGYEFSDKQIETLQDLKEHGVYKGEIPDKRNG